MNRFELATSATLELPSPKGTERTRASSSKALVVSIGAYLEKGSVD